MRKKQNPKKILAIRKFKEKNKIWNIRTEIQERKRGGEQNINRQRKSRSTSKFFSSVLFINESDGEIPNIELITIEHDCLEKTFQEKEVLKLLQDLNVGPDGLHAKMLKELSEALVKPLTIIYNTSLTL
jgi:hypothetical protein